MASGSEEGFHQDGLSMRSVFELFAHGQVANAKQWYVLTLGQQRVRNRDETLIEKVDDPQSQVVSSWRSVEGCV